MEKTYPEGMQPEQVNAMARELMRRNGALGEVAGRVVDGRGVTDFAAFRKELGEVVSILFSYCKLRLQIFYLTFKVANEVARTKKVGGRSGAPWLLPPPRRLSWQARR